MSRYAHVDGLAVLGRMTEIKRRTADVIAGVALRAVPSGATLSTVVDIGCGDGTLTSRLAELLPGVRRWILVDADRRLLARCRDRLHDGDEGVRREVVAVAANINRLPLRALPDGQTLLVAAHVLYYSADWRASLAGLLALRADISAVVVRAAGSCSVRIRDAVRLDRQSRPGGLHGEMVEEALASDHVRHSVWNAGFLYGTGICREDVSGDAAEIRGSLARHPDLVELLSLWCHAHVLSLDDTRLLSLSDCLMTMIEEGDVLLEIDDRIVACYPHPESAKGEHNAPP